MRQLDILSRLISAKNTINMVVGVIILISLILAFFAGWGFWVLLFCALAIFLAVNSFAIVSPGHRGYRITLGGYMSSKSFTPGLKFIYPFISSMTEVDVRLQKHEDTNVMKTKNLRDITLKYALTYQINEDYVPWLHAAIGEDKYIDNALCPWLDAIFTEVIAEKTYEDINGHLGELSREIEEKYLRKVAEGCYDYTKNYDGAEHKVVTTIPGAAPKVSYEPGVNLFSNMAVAIIDVKFDDEYTKTVSELASVEKQKEIVEKKAEQLLISQKAAAEAKKIEAEAEAEALKMKAAAEAEAMKLKGASENEVRERLGEILKSHPELIKEVLAKNFPKVYGGGATPLINLDELLGEKK